jgi:hypothetical protein
VLYIDPAAPIADQIQQISEHMAWIQDNPQAAIAMSEQAHQIFLNHYSLEHLLEAIVPYHQQILQQKGFTANVVSSQTRFPSVQCILRVTAETLAKMPDLLTQIAQQTYPNLGIILSKPADLPLKHLPNPGKFPITIIDYPTDRPSTSLWAGLTAIDADYFALLDPTGKIYPNHIHALVSLLEKHPEAGVAYAGSVRTFAESESEQRSELAELAHFAPLYLERTLQLNPPFPPNGFLARRSLLDSVLLQDPQLHQHEILCLILHLLQRTQFVFSYEVTCETTQSAIDPQALLNEIHDWSSELSRLKFIFWNQEFAPGKTLQTTLQSTHSPDYESLKATIEQYRVEMKQLHKKYKTETNRFQEEWRQAQAQLQEAHDRITAMETSKFWKLRSAWFRIKRKLGVFAERGQSPQE